MVFIYCPLLWLSDGAGEINGRDLLMDISMTLMARGRDGERSQGTSRE